MNSIGIMRAMGYSSTISNPFDRISNTVNTMEAAQRENSMHANPNTGRESQLDLESETFHPYRRFAYMVTGDM